MNVKTIKTNQYNIENIPGVRSRSVFGCEMHAKQALSQKKNAYKTHTHTHTTIIEQGGKVE